jgi:hypothetical protein
MTHPDRPPPARPRPSGVFSRLLGALGSLRLAVVLIALFCVLLTWAAGYVERQYGTEAVHFAVYRTWWFTALGGLLGLNVLCATLARFPWKRHQAGFVVVHVGILVLLVGTWVGGRQETLARVAVFEGQSTGAAYRDAQFFELNVLAGRGESDGPIRVPFRPGPFSWDEYRRLGWFPWRLADRTTGVLYDRDGLRLEVLDYYADSQRVAVPRITIRTEPARPGRGPLRAGQAAEWTMTVTGGEGPHAAMRPTGMGERQVTPQGHRVLFWMAGSQGETEAFLHGAPEPPLGPLGQVVLWSQGKAHHFGVDQLQREGRRPLGETGLEVELSTFNRTMLGVQLLVHGGEGPPAPMSLFAFVPHANRHADARGVYGSYWFDPASADEAASRQFPEAARREAAAPRVEIVQGHDRRLYYRQWDGRAATEARPWPTAGPAAGSQAGASVVAVAESESPLRLTLLGMVAAERPDWEVQPVASRQNKDDAKRRANVRLTVDGHSEEFWVASAFGRSEPDEQRIVNGPRRRVAVRMPFDEIELGFRVHLRAFRQRLDPGSRQAAEYSSVVDFLPADDRGAASSEPPQPLAEDVLVTLNAPVDFRDPASGRVYRFFQVHFEGPWRPGDPIYDQLVTHADREELYRSYLSVNYDPGRGLKYFGSALIIAGIAMMYYMKAYFFKGRGARGEG